MSTAIELAERCNLADLKHMLVCEHADWCYPPIPEHASHCDGEDCTQYYDCKFYPSCMSDTCSTKKAGRKAKRRQGHLFKRTRVKPACDGDYCARWKEMPAFNSCVTELVYARRARIKALEQAIEAKEKSPCNS